MHVHIRAAFVSLFFVATGVFTLPIQSDGRLDSSLALQAGPVVRLAQDLCPQTSEEAATAQSAVNRHQVLTSGKLQQWIADKTYDYDSLKMDMLEWSQSLFDNQQDAINNFVNFLEGAEAGQADEFAETVVTWALSVASLTGNPFVDVIATAVDAITASIDLISQAATDSQDNATSYYDAAVRFRDKLSGQRASIKKAIDSFVVDVHSVGTETALIAAYNATTFLIETLPSQRDLFNGYTGQYLRSFNFIMEREMGATNATDKKQIMFLNEPSGITMEFIWKRLMDVNPSGCLASANFNVSWWVANNNPHIGNKAVYWHCGELLADPTGRHNHCRSRSAPPCDFPPVVPDGAVAWCKVFQHSYGSFMCHTDHFIGKEDFHC